MLFFHLFVALTSVLAYLSYAFKNIQSNVFVLLASWCIFIFLYIISVIFGPLEYISSLHQVFSSTDFYSLVIEGMLGYLLFAGCLHIDIYSFFKHLKVIATLAIVTTLLSFLLTAYLIHIAMYSVGYDHSLVSCFLYAAVIAPTDPVAVLALLKNLNLSKALYAKVASESLLNDGVGVVLFVSVLKFAHVSEVSVQIFTDMLVFFLYEGLLGLLFGLFFAYIVVKYSSVRKDKKIGNQNIFLLLSLLNLGYIFAKLLHFSPPLVAVGSGLYCSYVIQSLEEDCKNVIFVFWDTIDEILNYSLFFIVGFQVIFVETNWTSFLLMFLAILVNFFVRVVSVSLPLLSLRVGYLQNTTLYKTLVLGGLKGGLSLALALSIPSTFSDFDMIFDMTYAVVAFTVIVQGLSIERYLKLVKSRTRADELVI